MGGVQLLGFHLNEGLAGEWGWNPALKYNHNVESGLSISIGAFPETSA
ncbi:MAG: hypothetical protein SV686_05675 [Thermodesulfobacteriota bacterium]|nr:hypothetical protein [Thermodesulfobacteriota bacterium]